MLHGQRSLMDKVDLEERLAQAAPAFSRAAPLIVGVFSILTLVLAGNLYVLHPRSKPISTISRPKRMLRKLTTAYTPTFPTR